MKKIFILIALFILFFPFLFIAVLFIYCYADLNLMGEEYDDKKYYFPQIKTYMKIYNDEEYGYVFFSKDSVLSLSENTDFAKFRNKGLCDFSFIFDRLDDKKIFIADRSEQISQINQVNFVMGKIHWMDTVFFEPKIISGINVYATKPRYHFKIYIYDHLQHVLIPNVESEGHMIEAKPIKPSAMKKEEKFAYGKSLLTIKPNKMDGMKKVSILLAMLLLLILCWGNEKMGMDGNHASSKLFSMGEVIKRTIVRLREGLYILSHIVIKTMLIIFLLVFLFFMRTISSSYTVYRFEDRYVTFWNNYVMPYRYKSLSFFPEKNFILLNREGAIDVYEEDTTLLIYDEGSFYSNVRGVEAICLPDYHYEYFAYPDSASMERRKGLSYKHLSIRERDMPDVSWEKAH